MNADHCVDHGSCECGCGEKTTVSHVHDESKGWVAGLLEGEGSFSIKRSKRKNGLSCTPVIQLASTDEDVAVRLHKLIPAANVCKPRRKTKGGKQVYNWSLSRSAAVSELLICIFPLMSRRRQDRIREVLAHPTFERY